MNYPSTMLEAQEQASRAFARALDSGRLSHDAKAPNYVGHYMFMGPARDGRDAFKHRDTREYLA